MSTQREYDVNSNVEALKAKAYDLMNNGSDDDMLEANRLLSEVESIYEMHIEGMSLSLAVIFEMKASIATRRSKYRDAVALIAKAAETVPEGAEKLRITYIARHAHLLYYIWVYDGDKTALRCSARLYRKLMSMTDDGTFDWKRYFDWKKYSARIATADYILNDRRNIWEDK